MTKAQALTALADDTPKRIKALTIGLTLSCGRFGYKRRGDLSKIETDADRTALALGLLLVPRNRRKSDGQLVPEAAQAAAKALRAVEAIDTSAQRYLRDIGLSTGMDRPGVHRIPLALIEEVERTLEQHQRDRGPAVEAFCTLYPGLVGSMRAVLASQFDGVRWAEVDEVRANFAFSWDWFELDAVPERLQKASGAAYSRAMARMRANAVKVAEAVQDGLREDARDAIADVAARLADASAEDPRAFRQKTILRKLRLFLERWPARNVGGDTVLDGILANVERAIDGVDLEVVRKDLTAQAALRSDLEAAAAQVDTLLPASVRTRRAIRIEGV